MKRIFTICFVLAFWHTQLSAQSRGTYQPNQSELDVFIENNYTGLWDKTIVGFNTSSTDAFDDQYDANKLPGALNRETLYTLNGGQWMSINTLNSVVTNPIVPMGLEPGGTGTFTISFTGDTTFDNTTYVYLEDLQDHVMHNVKDGDYQFWADSSENWSRFLLHFTPPAVIASSNASCEHLGVINVTQPGPASWHYVLKDASQNTMVAGLLNENAPIAANVQAGTYTLTLTDDNNYVAVKTIVVSGSSTVIAGFSIPSIDVPVQTPVTFTNTSTNADTYAWDFGDGTGSTGVSNPTHTYTADGIYNVTLTVTNGLGCTSSTTQRITVGNTTTGVAEVGASNLTMWSHAGSVFVDFSQASKVDATVKIYDILGRELSNDKVTGSTVYHKALTTLDEAYVIVTVRNNNEVSNKKLFISNAK